MTGAADRDRQLRNLQAVYRHHGTPAASAPPEPVRWSAWKKRLAVLGPVGVALIFALGKLKFVLPALKFLKLGTVVTMFLSVWAYALFWGLPFALGFVLLIFVHEMGHVLVLRRLGIHAGAPVFIPFVGAVIAMKGLPRNAWVEALVGIGGPVLGGAGALACLVVAWTTGSLFWYSLASVGFLLNLFNLIPISPLDGGRITGVIGRGLWIAGYAIGIAVLLATWSPILLLILLLGLFNLGRTLRGPRPGYFETPARRRIAMGVAYFGLLALLAAGMYVADESLEPLRAQLDVAGAATGND